MNSLEKTAKINEILVIVEPVLHKNHYGNWAINAILLVNGKTHFEISTCKKYSGKLSTYVVPVEFSRGEGYHTTSAIGSYYYPSNVRVKCTKKAVYGQFREAYNRIDKIILENFAHKI